MNNHEIAAILHELAIYEEMKGEKFKPRAYEKAARSVESLQEELEVIYKEGGINRLMELPGVGKSIAQKIVELLTKGKLQHYEELKRATPVDVATIASIQGVGPKTVKTLYEELKITNIEELEKAAKQHKIRVLPGFGERTEQQVLNGIEFYKKSHGRFILGFVLGALENIQNRLRNLNTVKRVEIAGSVRRMRETIGDADFLIATSAGASDNSNKVIMDFFISMPEVVYVYSKGITKSAVRLHNGIDCDLRIVPEESFGAALHYFTGNKQHNVVLRTIALNKKYKLNEYGLFKGKSMVSGKTEEDIYRKLGLEWIPPEMRENTGEIEAATATAAIATSNTPITALRHSHLPKLIDYEIGNDNSLKGDLQMHTNWTDGNNSIWEMVEAADKIGLEYIVITDHSKSLGIAGGLDEKDFVNQSKEIEKINKTMNMDKYNSTEDDNEKVKQIVKVLKGVEVNIQKDGSLDLKDKILKEFDVVGASIHSYFNLSREQQTKRLISAMQNPNVDIIYHPSGRIINRRDPYDIDIEQIIHTARNTNTILEVDSYPDRLDLNDIYVRIAVENGCKISIDSDAHDKSHLEFLKFGIAQARRGWTEKQDVVNTLPLEEFISSLKNS